MTDNFKILVYESRSRDERLGTVCDAGTPRPVAAAVRETADDLDELLLGTTPAASVAPALLVLDPDWGATCGREEGDRDGDTCLTCPPDACRAVGPCELLLP